MLSQFIVFQYQFCEVAQSKIHIKETTKLVPVFIHTEKYQIKKQFIILMRSTLQNNI